MADLLLVFSLVFAVFFLYAAHKQDNDPDWAFASVIVLIFTVTILGGIAGWVLGSAVDKDVTFLAQWHVLGIIMAVVCALITYSISTVMFITGLSMIAYDKKWNKLSVRLEHIRRGWRKT